jgi:hypothetical protein
MAALWYRFRIEARGRWRSTVVLGVIAGLVGAAVVVAFAGSRRTSSAYERMLAATHAPDFVVRGGTTVTLPFGRSAVLSLPGVARVGRVERFYLTTQGPRATLGERTPVFASGSVDGRAYYSIGQPEIVEGRMPRPDRANEILVSRILERDGGFHVGDRSRLVVVVPDASAPDGLRAENVTFRIVGVGVTADQIALNERRQSGLQLLLTPAFARAHRAFGVESSMQISTRGPRGKQLPAELRALAPSTAIDVASIADDRDRVDRATRPQVVALWLSGVVLALAAALVIAQSITRQLALDAFDDPVLGALGLGRRQRFALGMLRAAPIALVAAVVAVIGAVAASPLMPIGAARVAEPDPGISVDGFVVGLGGFGVLLLMLALAVLPAWRLAGQSLIEDDDAGPTRRWRSRVADRLARWGAPPPAVAGTRFALEPGRGTTAVPTRATLVGMAAAGTAVVVAVVGAANLHHLVDTPRVWGATWDVNVSVAADPREVTAEFDQPTLLAAKQLYVKQQLDASVDVRAWSVSTANTIELNGRSIPALGVDRRGGVLPAVVDGRLPRGGDEIALGDATMAKLGVHLGDRITAERGTLRVVGVTVLPRFQTLGGADEAALNRGAVLTMRGLLSRSSDFYARTYLVRLRPGVTTSAATKHLTAAIPSVFAFDVSPVAAPEDIEALDRVTGTPIVLAAMLAVLALATLLHVLITSIRRRRRDVAILVALGFTRRQIFAQVSATVAWQASVIALASLVVGLPLGIAGGRWLSARFADDLGAVRDVVVPVGTLAVIVVASIVLANLVAFVPGRLAARTQPAVVLRSE